MDIFSALLPIVSAGSEFSLKEKMSAILSKNRGMYNFSCAKCWVFNLQGEDIQK